VNNLYYGGIAAYQNFIFVTDMATFNGGEPSGIIRFNTSNNTAVRFADGHGYTNLSMGLDGKLYTPGVTVYDPVTMQVVRQFSLPTSITSQDSIRTITADQAGRLFLLGDQKVYRLSQDGTLEASRSTGFSGLRDMNIDERGRIVIGQAGGRVIIGDTTLEKDFKSFQAFTNPGTIFVSFARSMQALSPDPSPIPIASPTPTSTPTPAPIATPMPEPTPVGRPTPTPAFRGP
jgi:class 3 adenylate cyclase